MSAGTVDLITSTDGSIKLVPASGRGDVDLSVSATADAALKPAAADGVQFVTLEGNDANDGLSWGTAKLTIAAAAAALPTNGGSVFLGAGVHVLAAALTLPQNVVLRGITSSIYNAGPTEQGAVLHFTAGAGYAITIDAPNAGLRDLTIVVDAGAAGGLEIVDAGGTDYCVIDNVTLSGPGTGIGLYMHGHVACSCHNTFSNLSIIGWATGMKISGNANANLFASIDIGNVSGWSIDISVDGVDPEAGSNNTWVNLHLGGTDGLKLGATAQYNTFVNIDEEGVTGTGLADAGANNQYIGGFWVATGAFAAPASSSFFGTSGLPAGYDNRIGDMTLGGLAISALAATLMVATNNQTGLFAKRTDGAANQRISAFLEQGGLTGIGRAADDGTFTNFIGLRQSGAIGLGQNSDTGANTIGIGDGYNVVLSAGTGTKIGTATNQKLAFWNAAPAAQQVLATGAVHTVDDVIAFLQSIGLCRQA